MKRVNLFLILLLSVSFVAKSQNIIFHYKDTLREYIEHVPSIYKGDKKVPLLIALHCSPCKNSDFVFTTGFNQVSDTAGFIVVYPKGVETSWNGGLCCNAAFNKNIDDVGFISALIDSFLIKYEIDSSKVFVAGFSNGAIMSYALGAQISKKIAGIASVAGTMMVPEFKPEKKIPIIQFHAWDDSALPITGGKGPSGYTFPSFNSVLDLWKLNNQCSEIADTIVNAQGVRGLIWKSPNDSSNIILYTSATGGHSWFMNSQLPIKKMIWEFFTKGIAHAELEKPKTEILSNEKKENLNIFALNSSYVTIEFYNKTKGDVIIEFISASGKKIVSLEEKGIFPGIQKFNVNYNFNPGLYFVRVTSNNLINTGKLIVH